jgi:hypothetical protein
MTWRQGNEIAGHVAILPWDLEYFKAVFPQCGQGLPRDPLGIHHGQVLVDEAQDPIEVDRDIGGLQLHTYNVAMPYLTQCPFHLIRTVSIGSLSLCQECQFGPGQGHISSLKGTRTMDGHQDRNAEATQGLSYEALLTSALLRSWPCDDGSLGGHQHQIADKVQIGLRETSFLDPVHSHAMGAIDGSQRVKLRACQVWGHRFEPEGGIVISDCVNRGSRTVQEHGS